MKQKTRNKLSTQSKGKAFSNFICILVRTLKKYTNVFATLEMSSFEKKTKNNQFRGRGLEAKICVFQQLSVEKSILQKVSSDVFYI